MCVCTCSFICTSMYLPFFLLPFLVILVSNSRRILRIFHERVWLSSSESMQHYSILSCLVSNVLLWKSCFPMKCPFSISVYPSDTILAYKKKAYNQNSPQVQNCHFATMLWTKRVSCIFEFSCQKCGTQKLKWDDFGHFETPWGLKDVSFYLDASKSKCISIISSLAEF